MLHSQVLHYFFANYCNGKSLFPGWSGSSHFEKFPICLQFRVNLRRRNIRKLRNLLRKFNVKYVILDKRFDEVPKSKRIFKKIFEDKDLFIGRVIL